MAVYIDPLRVIKGYTLNWPYTQSCHMFADSIKELDDFAHKIGLRVPGWRHNIHYDLTANKRKEAKRLGAIEVSHGSGVYLRVRQACYEELRNMKA